MIDEGECDWKLFAINEVSSMVVDRCLLCTDLVVEQADPLAAQISDVADLERLMPGKVCAVICAYYTSGKN